jgi:hypothetical protein
MICAVVSRVLGWLQWSPGRNSAARRRRLVTRCEVAVRNPFRAGRLPDVVRNGAQRQIDDAARLMFGAEACTRLPWNINTDPGLPVGATMPPSLTRPRHGLVRREPVKKIALEEHFTTPTLLRYSHEGGIDHRAGPNGVHRESDSGPRQGKNRGDGQIRDRHFNTERYDARCPRRARRANCSARGKRDQRLSCRRRSTPSKTPDGFC